MQTPISRITLTATATTSSYHNHKYERNPPQIEAHNGKRTSSSPPQIEPATRVAPPRAINKPPHLLTLARMPLALSEI
ncbi:hypothetical protein E2542_SST03696 [Spatholobus suberectus]|nr:hypothetical protein E2542_SST03696 [Spatholobus suberectus]